jgi:dihydrodipicolinate synthase/N-acetylneuraminate lyase
MKAAMEILGMTTSPVRPPMLDCTAKDVADLKGVLKPYADVVAAAAR